MWEAGGGEVPFHELFGVLGEIPSGVVPEVPAGGALPRLDWALVA